MNEWKEPICIYICSLHISGLMVCAEGSIFVQTEAELSPLYDHLPKLSPTVA